MKQFFVSFKGSFLGNIVAFAFLAFLVLFITNKSVNAIGFDK